MSHMKKGNERVPEGTKYFVGLKIKYVTINSKSIYI